MITVERFSGEREEWSREAEPALVECEEPVWLPELVLLAPMPLEPDLSASVPGVTAARGLVTGGCSVLEPELPCEEEEVMAVTSASRPSLTTLTLSTSGLRCLKSFSVSCSGLRCRITPVRPLLRGWDTGPGALDWLRLRVSNVTTRVMLGL